MTEFKKGDRVRVNSTYTLEDAGDYVGLIGTITQDKNVYSLQRVRFDGGLTGNFYVEELSPAPLRRRLTVTRNTGTSSLANYAHPDGIKQVFEGEFDFEVEEIDPHTYVQVKTGSYSRLTYVDPSGTLAVGDRVLVPLGYYNTESTGVVLAIGRGEYTGPCKSAIARLAVEAL